MNEYGIATEVVYGLLPTVTAVLLCIVSVGFAELHWIILVKFTSVHGATQLVMSSRFCHSYFILCEIYIDHR